MRKSVFGVSDQVRHKPGCTAAEDGWRLEILDLGSGGDCTIRVAKTKALISVFVFAYAKSRFSHSAAQLILFNSNSYILFITDQAQNILKFNYIARFCCRLNHNQGTTCVSFSMKNENH